MKKREQIHGHGLVVSLALVVALIGTAGYIVFLSDEVLKSTPSEVEPQPPIPAIPPYPDVQALTEEEKAKAIELAINDPEGKKWLGEGYEVYEVTPLEDESSRMCMVYILTEEKKLPWVLGITIGVPVDLIQGEAQGGCINYDLKLASLTEKQKDEVLKIALADPEVLEMIGNKEYKIQNIEVDYWESSLGGKCYFHAYPTVSIAVNLDPNLSGIFATIYVDLESSEVIRIFTYPRKSLPPSDWQSTKIEPTKEVPMMADIPHLTPQPGEYFTYRGNKSKILLNDSRLKYCSLELNDICSLNAANVGDLGIVITGTIKNEYDRDYYICMAAHAFNSEGEQIGGSIDPGPVCGIIAPYVKSGQTEDFELHLKYREDIERIELFVGCVSEIPPP
ncbi:MAG: hypothetical protein PHD13_06955 [Methanocellales archaeon]|nr:hypothetical protein [Methanocellales archaeon]MDD3292389.1 hypothetical protein [Methanocellales archaeon]MDD5235898.1 hypothetical protein [Methanocellales archaeon]MDD5485877.1 hypothetical protein [Methanocellales archaeon]